MLGTPGSLLRFVTRGYHLPWLCHLSPLRGIFLSSISHFLMLTHKIGMRPLKVVTKVGE